MSVMSNESDLFFPSFGCSRTGFVLFETSEARVANGSPVKLRDGFAFTVLAFEFGSFGAHENGWIRVMVNDTQRLSI